MFLQIGKIYQIYKDAHWSAGVYNNQTNKMLDKEALITLVEIKQKRKRSGSIEITFIFLYNNELFWHCFHTPSPHAKDVKEGKVFKEII